MHYVQLMEKQNIGNRFKPQDLIRIINATDTDGNKFIPIFAYYTVLSAEDGVLEIGIGPTIMHKIIESNVEPYI